MDNQFTSRDWANISNLVLYLIFQKLSSISDCLRFSAVCKSWLSFVSNNYDALKQRINSSTSPEEMPLLMIFSTNRGSSTTKANFYSVTKGKTVFDLKLPLPSTWRCCGSSHGWLAFQRSDSCTIHLFNSFSGETINLPSPYDFVDRVILSKNPSTSPSDFEVVATFKSLFEPHVCAILKPGSNTWIFTLHDIWLTCVVCDVIYYDDGYYVVTSTGSVLFMDKLTLDSKEISGPRPVIGSYLFSDFYLVKTTTNELSRVQISHEPTTVKTSKLVVSPITHDYMFEELDNLGDEALFLCNRGSMSILASKYLGCKANSVYFIDHDIRLESSACMMDLIHHQDGSYFTHFSFETSPSIFDVNMLPALWIIPTPKFISTVIPLYDSII